MGLARPLESRGSGNLLVAENPEGSPKPLPDTLVPTPRGVVVHAGVRVRLGCPTRKCYPLKVGDFLAESGECCYAHFSASPTAGAGSAHGPMCLSLPLIFFAHGALTWAKSGKPEVGFDRLGSRIRSLCGNLISRTVASGRPGQTQGSLHNLRETGGTYVCARSSRDRAADF